MSTMDGDQSSRFVSSLVKSIQALCNGYIDFSSSIEVIGHIHLNIDRSVKLDYVLTEEVSKSVSEGATVFASHSYHSQPPSSAVSKNASDSSSSNRNRSKQSQGDDGESAGFRSSTTDVHTPSKSDSHAQKRSSGHYGENSESSHSGSFVNTGDMLSLKQESPQKLCRTPESLDRRRKSAHGPQSQFHHHSPSPAVKRSRHSDSIPEREPQDFEVIEIKEEPDEAPAVFFGNSSSHMAAGQDLQTPDFSSVVMESLDRVSQVEGTDLVGEGGSMQQPFPVMMHSNPGMSSSSSSLAGPSQSDPQSQSLASTSGTRHSSSSQHAHQRPFASNARTHNNHSKSNNNTHSTNSINSISCFPPEAWEVSNDLYEQKRRDRAEAIQAAVDYVLQSGLPAYKVCSMFHLSKTTLYRHLAMQGRPQSERDFHYGPSPGPSSVSGSGSGPGTGSGSTSTALNLSSSSTSSTSGLGRGRALSLPLSAASAEGESDCGGGDSEGGKKLSPQH